MSMSSCKKCGHLVDTDMDTDCYVANPAHLDRPIARFESQFICVCESCREKEIEDGEKQ